MTAGTWGLVAVIVILVVVSALFAAAETVITRINKVRAYRLAEEERRGASSLVKLAEDPPPYLNVVLLLMLLVHLGATAIATIVAIRLIGGLGELVATIAMTILLFVFAEVVPKTYAVLHTDRVALWLAPLSVGLTRAFGPIAVGLVKVANVIMPGKGLPKGPFVTEEEIKALAEVASEEEEIEEEEKELIHSIFEFGDTIVREVMTPEPDIVAIDESETVDAVLGLIIRHGYSRIPVFRKNRNEMVGVIYAKDVLRDQHAGRSGKLRDLMREPHFVPESKKVADLLRDMQREKFHLAIVVDEYGAVAGLVTLEDVLEEIVGEIADEYDREEPSFVKVAEGRFRVNARMPVDELSDRLEVQLPDTEWDTVGGLMMGILGRLPGQGEHVDVDGIRFTAELVRGRRIWKVLIERITQPAGGRGS